VNEVSLLWTKKHFVDIRGLNRVKVQYEISETPLLNLKILSVSEMRRVESAAEVFQLINHYLALCVPNYLWHGRIHIDEPFAAELSQLD
jgi:hypothetical protein